MAALQNILLTLSVVLCITAAQGPDGMIDDVDSCEEICDKSYASHTYENGDDNASCKRGCRFHSIMSFINDHQEPNATMADCLNSCNEAYFNETRGAGACKVGCNSQTRMTQQHSHDNQAPEDPAMHMLYPLLYMHSVYSNMVDKVYRHMEVTWSVFMQADSGQLVVVRSQPRLISIMAGQEQDEGTSMMMETNIAGQDNSATPLLHYRSQQMRSDQGVDMDVAEGWAREGAGRTDWLSCVARKTGIARVILCFLILATAVVMIWFCLTAAATAPEQHLSINGDLEYLRLMSEGGEDAGLGKFRLLHPQQARVEARPLPIKIRVEQI